MQKKTFEKTQYSTHDKNMGILLKFFNFIQNICIIPTASIILNGEKLYTFPLRLGTRKECPLSSL